MNITSTLKNIRCDTISCNKYASFGINTNSHKGCLNLCDDCFNRLYDAMKEMKKQINKINDTKERKK